MIQFNTKWYKKVQTVSFWVISWNYIVTCFSSQFVLNFCTQNDLKPIVLYSKTIYNQIFFNQTSAKFKLHYVNWDSVWKTRKQIFKYNLNDIILRIVFISYCIISIWNHILSLFCLDFAISPILDLDWFLIFDFMRHSLLKSSFSPLKCSRFVTHF